MERKDFPFAEFKVDAESGEFSGYGAVFSNVDGGRDIIMPGAFSKATIAAFLKSGFISWSHDWSQPVAMPTEAHADEKGLFLAGRFHSTPAAQEARTIAAERADAGMTTGLSIGYGVKDFKYDDKGNRVLKAIDPLFEVALAMVPMNPKATLSAIKSEDSPDGDSETESLADTVARHLGEGKALTDLFDRMRAVRAKEGRTLSEPNQARLREIHSHALDWVKSYGSLIDEMAGRPADPAAAKQLREIEQRLLADMARRNGVEI